MNLVHTEKSSMYQNMHVSKLNIHLKFLITYENENGIDVVEIFTPLNDKDTINILIGVWSFLFINIFKIM
jgi:hypothetical protein